MAREKRLAGLEYRLPRCDLGTSLIATRMRTERILPGLMRFLQRRSRKAPQGNRTPELPIPHRSSSTVSR
jgi:hypothetical protein